TLGLIDITIDRNAYGTQLDSFETNLTIAGIPSSIPVAFIRAPVITKVGKNVEVLASHEGKPVLVRQERILAGTFHPEVRGEKNIHRLFLTIV
ncbi:MAG: pyridoxal 5'-phosphate synthase glutaminase subunit PdxT, partial [Candidatus Peregrinibacteria bacterium]